MYRVLSAHGLFNLARAFIGAVLVIYLINQGIDLSVIAIAKSAQLVTSVIFNYPAGLISDRYGNKITILLACIAEIIYFSLMLNPTDTTVIVGEMFNGLGIALYVGAYEAWLFTHKKDNEDSFSLISRSSEALFIATILSGVIGAIFSQYSLFLSISFMAISFSVYAITPEKRKFDTLNESRKDNKSGISKLLKTADKNVINYVIIGGLIQLIYQFWPVFFKNDPIYYTPKEVGFVFAASMVAQWFFTSHARKNNFNKKRYAELFCYVGIIVTSVTTIFTPYYFTNNHFFVVISYCLFISFCTLTVNYYFSHSCDIYSGSRDESSMISLLDTSARCFGALALAIVSLVNIQNISIIWSIFPIFALIVSVTRASKKVLSYEF
ncbi:MFS transporter [Aeromonas veronii]|uniref:MFS transporter n=1 Tax=Aeromonas veronii TaxID=654 RepID=UPI001F1E0F78|nr:MFS transporter [Aeromonas veronii]MCF5891993.1 MFS transporter [Aeromonas veronii]